MALEPRLKSVLFRMVAEKRITADQAMAMLGGLAAEPEGVSVGSDIAVIGMSGRFGACGDLDALWQALDDGRDLVGPAPPQRWGAAGAGVRGAFLPDEDHFDAAFFRFSPTEAALMDPQQRVFLEQAFLALEDAGWGEAALQGRKVGVFVGAGANDYSQVLREAGVSGHPLALMGNVPSILAARIAYFLDLKGPALSVDTACSSSLVALHLACESLRAGSSDMALAGGVCVIATPQFLHSMTTAGMLSPSGKCHAFDARADGFVCGEGAGVVVLKRLDQAVAEGDRILGVIKGTGVNQDGRTNGITAPSAPSQEALEVEVYRRFGIDPETIGYVEAHGTGTELGDPIEVEALTRAFRQFTDRTGFCALGSVKTNIGHTLTAAGIAGLLKVLLALRHGRLPASLHFEAANPHIALADGPFFVADTARPWARGGTVRRAAISSFGFSGTNGHVVVEEAPLPASRPTATGPGVYVLSARDEAGLRRKAADLAAVLTPEMDRADLAFTLALGRTPLPERLVVSGADPASALANWLAGRPTEAVRRGRAEGDAAPPTGDLAADFLRGARIDWSRVDFGPAPRRLALPLTALQRVRHAIGPADAQQVADALAAEPPAADAGLTEGAGAFTRAEAWGRAMLVAVLAEGGALADRRVLTREALRHRLSVAADRHRLFDALLGVLERAGAAVVEGDVVRLSALVTAEEAQARRGVLTAEAAAAGPEAAPFLTLLGAALDGLPDVLAGRRRGAEVLFPDGQPVLVEAVYRDNPLADHLNRLLAEVVGRAVERRAGAVGIVEVGAGTGGATKLVLDRLAALAGRITYAYTDVSMGFVQHGRRAFGPGRPFLAPRVLDIEAQPDGQGFAPGGCGVILASNVLHATRRIGDTLARLHRMLEPGGVLVLNEVTAVQDFATLTFGLTEGWWAFEDAEARLPHSPLLDAEGWRTALAAAGFPGVAVLGLADHQAVIVAVRDHAPVPAAEGVATAAGPVVAEKASTDLEAVVIRHVAEALSLPRDAVDRRARFMDYGVDSILGGDLVARLNRDLGLSMRPTVVFDHPTVADLAAHLGRLGGAAPAVAPAAPVRAGDERIAVIGLSGRFATAAGIDAFRALLREGRSGITDVPPDRWVPEDGRANGVEDVLRLGGFLTGAELFDPTFFRISGREAELTDPQHRVFLTECWRALEDAGYGERALDGRRVGVFVGAHGGDYTHRMTRLGVAPDAFAFMGNAASILASRIAYILNLKGPCLAVDTACSSSLMALHLACRSILAGESEMALAGGVFINTTEGFNTAAGKAGMLSPTGRCATFDAAADGFVPGEGAGVVLLKPLARAVADGDRIDAVILASGTNQDGKTNGITAPSAESQATLLAETWRRAGIDPSDIGLIEAHGTGTPLGDPIEVEGLTRAFGQRAGACALGSVKTNVGHAAHAAGIAGFIKAVLSVRHAEIHPLVHFDRPNPVLHLEETPFRIVTALEPWQAGRRIAGISSFGFSGTNVHIVVGEAPAPAARPDPVGPYLIVLSAKSDAALAQRRADLGAWLAAHPDARLDDVERTLAAGRSHFHRRWAAVVEDVAELAAVLAGAPGRLNPMAEAYLRGEDIDLDGPGRSIALPTYPFEEQRYWLDDARPAPVPVAAPVVERKALLFRPVWRPAAAPVAGPLPPLRVIGEGALAEGIAEAWRAAGGAVVTSSEGTPRVAVVSRGGAAALRQVFEAVRAGGDIVLVHGGAPAEAAAAAFAPSVVPIGLPVTVRLVGTDDPAAAVAELAAATGPREVAWRGGKRFERVLAPLDRPASGATPWKRGGVYLITGRGRLAATLARHLVEGWGAKVAIVGRSAPAETLPGVEHFVADVADEAALSAAVTAAEALFGPLNGVVHMAGVPGRNIVSAKDWAEFETVLRPKVEGLATLDRVIGARRLDLFAVFASLAAELGDFGQCDYAVANAHALRFAAWRAAECAAGRRHGRTAAFAWPLWREGRQVLSQEGGGLYLGLAGLTHLETADGLAVLEEGLTMDAPEIIVAAGQPDKVTRLLVPPVAKVGSADAVVAELSGIVATLLKIDRSRIQPDLGLGEYGFDSIALKEFATVLGARWGIDVTPAVFFAHGTIAALAAWLVEEHGAAVEPAAVVEPAPVLEPADDAVAIIGMACRFPGSPDPEAFWRNLEDGRDLVGPAPDGRWSRPPPAGLEAGFIDGVDRFDHGFFKLSPREAQLMDPQHRLAIEASWTCVESAGLRMSALAGRSVGVYFAQQVNEYAALVPHLDEARAQVALGNVGALLPNRISWLFDFHGPSQAIDTACSGALVAVHRAARAVRDGEAEMALAGGVSLMLDADSFATVAQLGVASADGRCRPFGAGANGYVKGEGVGVVLLKPLAKALADGDPVLAILRGSAENHGGRAQSLTAPNPVAQAACIKAALERAGAAPRSIGLIEAHGTGTELGDPVEIEALKAAFGPADAPWCGVGSVKGNIGHLEPAAGIAGLIKAVQALRHGMLPPSLNLNPPNPHIRLDGSPFMLLDRLRVWPRGDAPRRAGVSAFGFGGSNAHVVVEEAPARVPAALAEPAVLPLSAPSRDLLMALVDRLIARLREEPDLGAADLAATFQTGREPMAARLAVVLRPGQAPLDRLIEARAHVSDGTAADEVWLAEGRTADVLGDDAEGRAYLADLLRKGRLDRVAALWVAGATIPWPDCGGRRVPLPGTPFAPVRCWFDERPARLAPAALAVAPEPAVAREVPGDIKALLVRLVADALYLEPEAIDTTAGLGDLGMDSILAVELVRTINTACGTDLQAARLYDYGTIDALAAYIKGAPVSATLPVPPSTDVRPQVRAIIAEALYIAPEDLDETAGFGDLGLDSILAVEVVRTLNAHFGTDLQAARLYDHPTVAALAAHIAAQEAPPVPVSGEAAEVLAVLRARVAEAAGLSPEAVDAHAPLTGFPLAPEVAGRLLGEVADRLGCRIDMAEVGRCRDLSALATLIAGRAPAVAPAPVVPTPAKPVPEAERVLVAIVADLLLCAPAEVDVTGPLTEIGLDMVQAAELARRAGEALGRPLSLRRLMDSANLRALAASLSDDEPPPPPVAPPPPPAPKVETEPGDIAIVGMACRYPGAPDLAAFWHLVRDGECAISPVPAERWSPDSFADRLTSEGQRAACGWGGFVEGVDRFDPLFFNLSPMEAALMDPQQRLFLEEAWHAFEDAGITRDALRGSATGVFVGVGQGDYLQLLPRGGDVSGLMLLGNTCSILTARIAYLLDLKGPAVAVDTACSSSLVAVDEACRSLRAGDCDLALAGGVNLMVTSQMHLLTAASNMLAPDGRCKTFDDAADGFVPGEGVGLTVLKRLDQALADGDRVYAVIRGCGVNQDGRSSSITAPSGPAQEALEVSVYERFGVAVDDIGLIEAHGTGTPLGDPIEVDALTRAFRRFTARTEFCGIGSVKTNIGHTLTASGAAGLIKAALALWHRQLPPSLHFTAPNRHIRFAETPFRVLTGLEEWAVPASGRRHAAVSSFGFSGTNAHVVLAEAPVVEVPPVLASRHLIVLSGADPDALRRQAGRLAAWCRTERPDLGALAHTLGARRTPLRHRAAWWATDVEALVAALDDFAAGGALPDAGAAAGWVAGGTLDWAAMTPAGRVLSPPPYAFARERYWLDLPDDTLLPGVAEPHMDGARFRLALAADHPWLAGHVVAGEKLLPGAVLIEAARSAAERALGHAGPLSLRDVAWRRPARAGAGGLDLTIDLVRDAEGTTTARLSASGMMCADVRLGGVPGPAGVVDVAALRARCAEPVAVEALYDRLEGLGIRYGAAFRRVVEAWRGEDEVLALIQSGGNGWLPPPVLDAALHAAAAGRGGEGAALLPAGIASVDLYAPLEGRFWSHLRPRPAECSASRFVCDIDLVAEDGRPLARLSGFRAELPGAGEVNEPLLIRPVWRRQSQGAAGAAPRLAVLHGAVEAEWAKALVAATPGAVALAWDGVGEPPAWPADTGLLVFCAWRAGATPLDAAALAEAERRGVFALRSVARRLAERPTRLLVVTRGVAPVDGGAAGDPAFAALPGFVKTLSREIPATAAACLDLPLVEEAAERAAHLALVPHEAGPEVALRGGVRLAPAFQALTLPAAPMPLAEGGLYMVVGGAGGLGTAVSRWLAETCGARLLWVGRRPETEVRGAVAEVEAAGGRVRYVQAGADLGAALAEAEREWGPLRGVIHSALVLRDRTIPLLTDDDMAQALAPKAAGLVDLVRVLGDRRLDFLVSFSSANALSCNPGQAAYAAACTFADGYLHWLGGQGWPVRIVNWGFFGDVGAVATEAHRARARAAGFDPLTVAEGLDAFRRLMAAGAPQAAVLKVLPERRAEALAGLSGEAFAVAPAASGNVEAARAGLVAPVPEGLDAAAEDFSEVVRHGRRRLAAAFRRAGLLRPGVLSVEALARQAGVVPQYHRLFDALIDILARSGHLLRRGDTVEVVAAAEGEEGPGDAATSGQRRLLDACLDRLVEVLRGTVPASEVLFPAGSPHLVEAVYAENPAADAFNTALAAAVRGWSGGRPLRILEVGAGTGSATRAVLAALDGVELRYGFTDVSPAFVEQARQKFAGRGDMEFAVLDIARPPREQGFADGGWDVVIASNVLHATADIAATLRHAKSVLGQGGLLVLNEAVATSDFATLTFGLTPGWWAFADPDRRLPHAPLLDVPGWRRVLGESGFGWLGAGGAEAGQAVILGASDGWVERHGVPVQPVAPAKVVKTVGATGTVEWLRVLLADLLRLDPAQIDPAEGYDRYGVDSLVGMELRTRLEQALGALPQAVVYEGVSVAGLAAALERDKPAELAALLGGAPVEAAPVVAAPIVARPDDGAVAIIGMAGRFPGAGDLDGLWEVLDGGRCAITEVPAERWAWRDHGDLARWGGFMDGADLFDPEFFGITDAEAAAMDPQERLILEQSWRALEDAGTTRATLGGAARRVGVFVGAMSADYLRLGAEEWAAGGPGQANTAFWSMANRVSHTLDLRGPSMAVDTACSSGLAALSLACDSLRSGRCEAALVGGVHLMLHPRGQIGLSQLGMISPTGRCRAFSAEADGFVEGEGVGVAVLKPLARAIADGDRIRAVIRGTAVGASGRTAGFMAPNPAAQAAVLAEALDNAGLAAGALRYVEAQASGSPVGDPVEAAALNRVLGRDGGPVPVGSVKPNIGHLSAASGLAQLAKVVLQFEHRRLAASLDSHPVSPDMALGGGRLAVQDSAADWQPGPALIVSVGAGGAVAAAVVEPPPVIETPRLSGPWAFPLSARDPEALRRLIAETRDYLTAHPDLDPAAVAATLQFGREAMASRMVFSAADLPELVRGLDLALAGTPPPAVEVPEWQGARPRPISLNGYPMTRRRCWFAAPRPVDLPATRRAVLIEGPGDVEDLRVVVVPVVAPGPGEVLISVRAFALNFGDLLSLRGLYPNLPPYPFTPGFEVAGVVAAVGAGVSGVGVGDAVVALTGGHGGQADMVTVPAVAAVRMPAGGDFVAACAFPVGWLTMRHALDRAALKAGETVLVQSAAGGIGPFAVQMARQAGARVLATAGSDEKVAFLAAMGAEAFNYRTGDFAAWARAATGGVGVDVVLNTLGGDAIQKGIDLLAPGGRYVEIALAGLKAAGGLDLSRLMDNQSLIAVNLGRILDTGGALEAMAKAMAEGDIRPVISDILPFSRLHEAYGLLAGRRNRGKVVVTMDEAPMEVVAPLPVAAPEPPPTSRAELLDRMRVVCAEELGMPVADLDTARPLPDYGLTSMSGLAIMRRLQRVLGRPVPVAALYEHPALDGLADALAPLLGMDAEPAATAWSPLVPIRAGGARTPSFWVHGAPGDVRWVVELAQRLGPDHPVWGLEARGLDGTAEPHGSVEDMARAYVDAILGLDIAGPIQVGGYSGGGVIAFHMVRLLQEAGRAVERLVLLDPPAPGSDSLRGMDTAFGEGFMHLLSANWFARQWGADDALLTADQVAAMPAAYRTDLVVEHLFAHAAPGQITPEDLKAFIDGVERVGSRVGQVLADYAAVPLVGPVDVLLVRCGRGMAPPGNPLNLPPFLAEGDYLAGWSALLPGAVEDVTIDCDHFGLMFDPACSALAALIEGADPVLAAVRAAVAVVLPDVDAAAVTAEGSLSDLGANSIDRVEVATLAMESLGLALPPRVLASVATLGDLLAVLRDGVCHEPA